jgi:D-alanyl-D-alanine carboxypeptidase (penicillin-binding protein 5/6)
VKLRLTLLAAAFLLFVPCAVAGAPQVPGRAYVVENGVTGEVLAAKSPNLEVPIASITKLMTVLVTLQHAKLGDVVTVGKGPTEVGEESIYLRRGEQLTVEELVEGALIQSANDAAVALADYVGGGNEATFVAMMNAEAQKLGLHDTHFANPDGLDQYGHYSSAHDVTRLARIAMKNPVIRGIVDQETATIPGRTLHTWNDLLGQYPGVFGVKTGHTNEAGWSQVAAARDGGVTIYATLLGEPSRAQRNNDLEELLTYGFTRYRHVHVIQRAWAYAAASTPFGRGRVALVAPHVVTRIVRIERPLIERVVAPAQLSLPVRKGQVLGEVRVYDGRKLLGREPLVAARSISKPGFVARTEWYGGRAWHHFTGWFS